MRFGNAEVIRDLHLDIHTGEVLALVGESGAGKTATALAIMDLLPSNATVQGRILLDGQDLRTLPPRRRHAVRGRDIAMVFQEPATALNPVLRVRTQLAEPLRVHRRLRGAALQAEVRRLLALVGLAQGGSLEDAYPHQISGGQQQRVMLAMALTCQPRLLLADEPTTALDVTVQATLLDKLGALRSQLGLAILLVSHDLGVVASLADRVAVLYAGRIVELAPVAQLFDDPLHPYTRGLLASVPDPFDASSPPRPIPGQPPRASAFPEGCAFHPRCPLVRSRCRQQVPELTTARPSHEHACLVTNAERQP